LRSRKFSLVDAVTAGVACAASKAQVGGYVSALRTDDAWQVKAGCRGPQAIVFFPPSHFERKDEKHEREQRAKAICATCPVKQPCLDYAIKIREPHGIWGGLNETERKQLLVQRGLS
jgi:WhiB family redox-sensing transcriptional regulator